MDQFTYLILSAILFGSFFILISIWGYGILSFLTKKNENYFGKAGKVFLSFGVGLGLYLFISSIFLYVGFFNIFSGYVLYIGLDIFITYKTRLGSKFKSIRDIIPKIKFFFQKNWSFIVILFVAFYYQFTIQFDYIERAVAYPWSDPFYWFGNIWYIHEYGAINWSLIAAKPAGFPLFGAGILLITDDFNLAYYCMAYLPVFLLSINLCVIFIISKKLFKSEGVAILALLSILGFNYLMTRYLMLLPSTLATSLGTIFLFSLGGNFRGNKSGTDFSAKERILFYITEKKAWVQAILLWGIFASHMLYFLFFFGAFISYIMVDFLNRLLKRGDKGVPEKKKTQILKESVISLGMIILIFGGLVLPFFIAVSFHHDFLVAIRYYFYSVGLWYPRSYRNILFMLSLKDIFLNVLQWVRQIFLGNWLVQFTSFELGRALSTSPFMFFLYRYTVVGGLTLIIWGCFVGGKKTVDSSTEERNTLWFAKVTFVFVFLLLVVISFVPFPVQLSSIRGFLIRHIPRLFELFPVLWVLILVLPIVQLKYGFNLLVKKIPSVQKWISRPQVKNAARVGEFSVLIFIGSAFYSLNIRSLIYFHHYNDAQMNAMLFMGEYFNKNPVNEPTMVFVDSRYFTYGFFGFQILQYNLQYEYFTSGTNPKPYSEFRETFLSKNCEYILIGGETLTPRYFYSFNEEPTGSSPETWGELFWDNSTKNSSCSLAETPSPLTKSVLLEKVAKENSSAGLIMNLSKQEYGRIWTMVYCSSPSSDFEIAGYSSISGTAVPIFKISIHGTDCDFLNGTEMIFSENFPKLIVGAWNYLIIDYKLSTASSGDLGQYQWRVSINNNNTAILQTSNLVTQLDLLNIQTTGTPLESGFSVFIDEIWIQNNQFHSDFNEDFEVLFTNTNYYFAKIRNF